jgi:hypothetical protein
MVRLVNATCLHVTAVLLIALGTALAQNELPPQGKKGKVCVAVAANSTSNSIFVENATDRLVKSLSKNEIDAVMMQSATAPRGKLEPDVDNGKESKDKDCVYTLLTRFVDTSQHPLDMQGPQISFGGKPSSVDAADPSNSPMGGDTLRIEFALFRAGRFKAVTDASVLGHRPNGVADNFSSEMDQEANRITHELNKK